MTTRAPTAASRARLPIAILLTAIILAAFVLRTFAVVEPLGIDQSLWASAVHGMSEGQRLYQDVWEQRPPGIYWLYLAGFNVFGWTPAAVVWLDVLAAAATALLLLAIGRSLDAPTTGLLAAALYAALTMPAWLYRYNGFLERSVCETFIVVCIAAGAWCATKYARRRSPALALGIGLFAGAAVVLKPNAALYFPALLAWTFFYGSGTASGGARAPGRLLAVAAAGAAVVPAATVLWLWRLDVLTEARVAIIEFNRFYVGEGFTLAGYSLDFSKAVWLRMKTDPLWLAGGVGALAVVWEVTRRRRLDPIAGLAVCWGGAAALVIVVNGARLFNSYFIQALAPLALLAAWLLTVSARRSRIRRIVAVVTASLMLILLVQRSYVAKVMGWAVADLEMLRGRADRTAYLERFGGYANARGYSARANAELAAYIAANSSSDDRLFLFGINGAGVYFLADRLTAHRFLRVNFFVATDFPDPRFRLEAVTEELARRRPRYLIFERLHSASEMGRAVDRLTDHPAVIRLLESYHFTRQIEDFAVYELGGQSP